jgi:hypothetical protein
MKTKTIKYLAVICLAITGFFFVQSCDTAKQYAAFDVNYNLPKTNFTYDGTKLKNGEVILYSGQVNINLDSLLMAHNVPTGWISSATFSQFEITIVSPPEATLDWLHSARAIVANSANFTPSAEIGSALVTNVAAKTLVLTMNNMELQPYIHNTSFYYQVLGVLNGPFPYDQVSMYLNSQVKVHVEPL